MSRGSLAPVDITPSARRLTGSLRDIGYDFLSALADIVDNSVGAGATQVNVDIVFDGENSHVVICDDGDGMTERDLNEALRFGTRREYDLGELGRYGLGLKTASISQCRRLTVASRRSLTYRRVVSRSLDLDHVENTDRWEVIAPPRQSVVTDYVTWLDDGPGTIVLWEGLDRVLPDRRPEGGWARRRLDQLAERSRDYLGMVFHRFLEGDAARRFPLTITVNGEKAEPWNPFAPMESGRIELPEQSFEVSVGDLYGRVRLGRFILPSRDQFSSAAEFERMSGPLKWNRQQGLYVYRADRLIQHGGWSGIRAVDEHTKLARASLDFQTDLDRLFQINVAKMRVAIPLEVKTLLERPINELCHRADSVYRREGREVAGTTEKEAPEARTSVDGRELGAAVISAALEAGEIDSFGRVMERLRATSPEFADRLGW
ncbi:MAG: ATP-binding protein [Acidimicrobiales bacterium]|nr:ATP-binding protein [Acidimicrobiales bacterium]